MSSRQASLPAVRMEDKFEGNGLWQLDNRLTSARQEAPAGRLP